MNKSTLTRPKAAALVSIVTVVLSLSEASALGAEGRASFKFDFGSGKAARGIPISNKVATHHQGLLSGKDCETNPPRAGFLEPAAKSTTACDDGPAAPTHLARSTP